MANDNLTGQTIASTYNQILITADTGGITGSGANATQIHCGAATAGAANADTTPLYLSTTRVGIGIAAPAYPVHLLATGVPAMMELEASVADSNAGIILSQDDTTSWTIVSDGGVTPADKLFFNSASLTAMTILQTGYVGIGVSDPDNTLEIAGTTYAWKGANSNTVFGKDAGLNCHSTGINNTFIGYTCGDDSQTGDCDGNVGVGSEALTVLTEGGHNTAVGYQAGVAVTTGANNTFLGMQAGHGITTGDFNIMIGKETSGVADANQQISIGYDLDCSTQEQLRIGDAANYLLYSFASGGAESITSDVRVKKDIVDTDLGLGFINALRPIKYTPIDKHEYPSELFKDGVNKIKKGDKKLVAGERVEGFIAQEVKQVMDDLNVTFSGWHQNKSSRQMLGYSTFVVPLVKAVQELSAKVEALEGQNNNEQGDSGNEQQEQQEQSAGSGDSGGDSSSEFSGQDSGGAEADSSDPSSAEESASGESDSSSGSFESGTDDGDESSGSVGSNASDDSEGGSGEDDGGGSASGEPSAEWTKNEMKIDNAKNGGES